MPSIAVENISKSFRDVEALKNISLSVEKGELFGLLGPDGAGKTTLFRILTSLLIPDKGDAWVEGRHTVRDYKAIRKFIGYMPGKFSLYQDLTVEENLNFFAAIFQTTVSENYHLIQDIYVALEPFKKRRAGKLSGGMKQKLALCCALIHEPEVLFLDEPTTGVDAVSRAEFWEMLKRLRDKGITMLVSTPYMDEASRCERIAMLQEGRILRIDRPKAITESYDKPLYALRSANLYELLTDLRRYEFTQRAEPFGDTIHLTGKDRLDETWLKDFLTGNGHFNVSVRPIAATIEDVFLDLM